MCVAHHEHPFRQNQFNKPTAKIIPIKSQWRNNYVDAIPLLQAKLLNHVRLTERVRENIGFRARLIEVTETEIIVRLDEFVEAYKLKFIAPDFQRYCLHFILFIEPVLADFLKEIDFVAHVFKFRFHQDDKIFEQEKKVIARS